VAFAARNSDEAQDKILANWRSVSFDEATLQVLISGANSLRYLHLGAAIKHCDWGLPLNEGVNVLLPHLGKARDLTRLAILRARYDLENGRSEAGVDGIIDAFTLARHAGADPVLISKLVQYAMESMVVDVTADHLLNLDTAARTHLAAFLRTLPPSGHIEDCMGGERELVSGYLVKALKAADPKTDWVDQIFISTNVMPAEEARATVAAAGGTPQSVLKCLSDLDPLYPQLAQVLALPPKQFQTQLEPLKKQFEANPIGKRFLPAFIKSYEQSARARVRFAMLQAAIAVSLDGPDKLKEYPDPAGQGLFEYRPLAQGFALQSAVVHENQPVTLIVR
jgi:hypothetical protein